MRLRQSGLPARLRYLPKDLTFALSAVSTEPTDASETFCFSGVCSMLTRMYTALNTHTHTHSPLYKTAFLVGLFTDVYQHHTVCTAFRAAECQWQQTHLPLDCKCESSAFTPLTSRHLLLMWSAWMSVCVHKNSKAWTTVKFTLYCHCTTIKHGYR